jgi:methyl-accepting chemotaxis protein/hemerythrin
MTKKIVWSDQIRTGHKYIDLQHQELIDLINELADSLESGVAVQEEIQVLGRLENYVIFHFNMEENLMANHRVNMEHAQQHMKAHERFCEQIGVYKRNLHAVDPQAIVDFLVTWLVEHIQKTDQELARLLAD